MPFYQDRWLLTAEFDSVAETVAAGAYEGGPGEAAEFYAFVRQRWETGLEEDLDEMTELSGDTVRMSCNVIDAFSEPLSWLLLYSVPKSVTLRRTAGRDSG